MAASGRGEAGAGTSTGGPGTAGSICLSSPAVASVAGSAGAAFASPPGGGLA